MPAPTGNTTTYFTNAPGGVIQINSRVWSDINGFYDVPNGYYFDNTTNTSWYVQGGYAITEYYDPCFIPAPTPTPTPSGPECWKAEFGSTIYTSSAECQAGESGNGNGPCLQVVCPPEGDLP